MTPFAGPGISRRRFLAAGATALGGLAAQACASTSAVSNLHPSRPPSGGGRRIAILDDNTNHVFDKTLFAEFRRRTGITVTHYEQANFNDLHDRLATLFRAEDSSFDIVMTYAAWSAEFGSAGWLQPIPHSAVPADIIPAALDAVSYGGVVFGLPKFASAQTMFFNKELFRDAGLDPDRAPVDWRQFVNATRRLTGHGVYGYANDMGNTDGAYQNFIRMLLLCGGSFYGPHNAVTFDSARGVQALTLLVALLRTEKVMNPNSLSITNSSDLSTLFADGKTGIVFNWPSQYAAAVGSSSKIGRAQIGNAILPGVNVRSASIDGSEGFAINGYSKNKAAAFEWLKFVTSDPVQAEIVKREGWFPVTRSLLHSATARRELPVTVTYGIESHYKIKRYGAPWYSDIVEELSTNITKAMLGQMAPKDALHQSADMARQIIGQYT